MKVMFDVLDDVMAQDARQSSWLERHFEEAEGLECDGCGEIKPDVDVYAENQETGEQIRLCIACGDW